MWATALRSLQWIRLFLGAYGAFFLLGLIETYLVDWLLAQWDRLIERHKNDPA